MKIELGSTVTDKLSGFTGVVIGLVKYITGCNQALVQARNEKPSEEPKSFWFDESRLLPVDAPRVYLDNSSEAHGFCEPAPKR